MFFFVSLESENGNVQYRKTDRKTREREEWKKNSMMTNKKRKIFWQIYSLVNLCKQSNQINLTKRFDSKSIETKTWRNLSNIFEQIGRVFSLIHFEKKWRHLQKRHLQISMKNMIHSYVYVDSCEVVELCFIL